MQSERKRQEMAGRLMPVPNSGWRCTCSGIQATLPGQAYNDAAWQAAGASDTYKPDELAAAVPHGSCDLWIPFIEAESDKR